MPRIPKSKKNAKNDEWQIERRRLRIAELYCEGKHQWQIGEIVGLGQSAVHEELKKIREEWKQERADLIMTKVERELERLDHLEAMLWDRFRASMEDAVVRVKRTDSAMLPDQSQVAKDPKSKKALPGIPATLQPIKSVTEITRKGQVGDPRWTEQIQSIIEMRLKILGAFKPEIKFEQNNNNTVVVDWASMYERVEITDPAAGPIAAITAGAGVDGAGSVASTEQVPQGDEGDGSDE